MTTLVEKLNALNIDDKKQRKYLFGYIYRVKKGHKFYLCKNDFVVIQSFDEKKMILCKLERSKNGNIFSCFECEHLTLFEHMGNVDNFAKTNAIFKIVSPKLQYLYRNKLYIIVLCQ